MLGRGKSALQSWLAGPVSYSLQGLVTLHSPWAARARLPARQGRHRLECSLAEQTQRLHAPLSHSSVPKKDGFSGSLAALTCQAPPPVDLQARSKRTEAPETEQEQGELRHGPSSQQAVCTAPANHRLLSQWQLCLPRPPSLTGLLRLRRACTGYCSGCSWVDGADRRRSSVGMAQPQVKKYFIGSTPKAVASAVSHRPPKSDSPARERAAAAGPGWAAFPGREALGLLHRSSAEMEPGPTACGSCFPQKSLPAPQRVNVRLAQIDSLRRGSRCREAAEQGPGPQQAKSSWLGVSPLLACTRLCRAAEARQVGGQARRQNSSCFGPGNLRVLTQETRCSLARETRGRLQRTSLQNKRAGLPRETRPASAPIKSSTREPLVRQAHEDGLEQQPAAQKWHS